ncbi:MAG: RNA polymerase factor sigma-70 [Gammaproteobacteria bacterium]|nr:RNA polymerase factor sigma-70 [Gammaproteobacteria bacterium]MBI5617625.1 RNA polymerase factor sigma-70 [Gammaproteobacteria bacterium]
MNTAAPAADPNDLTDPAFLETLRRQMLKFAILQLGDAHIAEDAVQEALIGALKNAGSFRRGAALKTWVFAILKNKIADVLRQRQRMNLANPAPATEDDGDEWGESFDRKGYWQPAERPLAWADPEGALESVHFWRVFETCLEHLPASQARVFMMREMIELNSDEVCAAAGITVSNLHVMLYRARLRLRECLENHWFKPGRGS